MTLAAALLAGGSSSRMGVNKATLRFAGECLWQRQLGSLGSLAPGSLWVSARTRPDWCPRAVSVALDRSPSRGPLSGIVALLEQARATHLLVLAVDLPRMNAPHLSQLWSRARAGRGVVPMNDDYFEPLCAVYPIEALPALSLALDGHSTSMQPILRDLARREILEVVRVSKQEQPLYENWNAPADRTLD